MNADKIKRLIRITFKSLIIRNRGNTLFLICSIVIILIPAFFYTSTHSIMHHLRHSHKQVFGDFTDIYYDMLNKDNSDLDFSEDDLKNLLPGFHYSSYGVISTVYTQELSESKKMYMGYADSKALELSALYIIEGSMPQYDSEIAITQSIAELLGNKKTGDMVELNGTTYTISGLIRDFGHLWPKGVLQIDNDINPVNSFVTSAEASRILETTGVLSRQILIVRQTGISNPVENDLLFFRNVNSASENQIKFTVPSAFYILIFITSIMMIIMVLALNRQRVLKRYRNYHLLGLQKKEIIFIGSFELMLISAFGLLFGTVIGNVTSAFTTALLSSSSGQNFPLTLDYRSMLLMMLAGFINFALIISFYIRHIVKKIYFDNKVSIKPYKPKKHKISVVAFKLWQSKNSIILLILLIMFSYSLLSYGFFYGRFFSKDILHTPPGTIVKDYDFQFVARLQPAPQLKKGETPFYFTDTYEKIGADNDFINQLLKEPAIKSIKAYKEINKMHVLLRFDQADDYLDAFDAFLDGRYDQTHFTGFIDFDFIRKHFDYREDEFLAGAEVLVYPPNVLNDLEGSVTEGKIDMEKIISGEEVVLRVPSFTLDRRIDGGIARIPVSHLDDAAFNSTTFMVGDYIKLSGILTDEMLNGPVTDDKVGLYQRHDISVRIGAIIRNTDGTFPYRGTVAGRPFSILTVDQALMKMGISATHSILSIYTNEGYEVNDLSRIISMYSNEVPFMILQDWQAELHTYKVYNIMIYIFVSAISAFLISAMIMVLTTQLMIRTRLDMRTNALMRINGLSFILHVKIWLSHIAGVLITGCLIGIPVAMLFIQLFGIKARFDITKQLNHYFPAVNFVFVFIIMLVITAISSIPSIIYMNRHKNNILFDIL